MARIGRRMPRKFSLDEVNNLDRESFVGKFGTLYEHSPWVAEAASETRPFDSLDEMHDAFTRAVREAAAECRMSLIKAHPDLAGKAAMAGDLTPESNREQSSAGLDRLSPEEYEVFTELNRLYKEKFGIPMIFAVRDHTRDSILANARDRLENTTNEEEATALQEIFKIGRYRLEEAVE